jgi:hypothetical protein
MWKVYAVKTLYRTTALGKPKKTDDYYRENLDSIEERIVTIKARNFDEAISKGEKEAKKYASETNYLNPYGQKIKQKYIGSIDIFEPFAKIEAKIEIFSTTFLINSSISNTKLTNNIMGKVYKNEKKLRIKFFNSQFSGTI